MVWPTIIPYHTLLINQILQLRAKSLKKKFSPALLAMDSTGQLVTSCHLPMNWVKQIQSSRSVYLLGKKEGIESQTLQKLTITIQLWLLIIIMPRILTPAYSLENKQLIQINRHWKVSNKRKLWRVGLIMDLLCIPPIKNKYSILLKIKWRNTNSVKLKE